jgi:hypothetical protein
MRPTPAVDEGAFALYQSPAARSRRIDNPIAVSTS